VVLGVGGGPGGVWGGVTLLSLTPRVILTELEEKTQNTESLATKDRGDCPNLVAHE